MIIAKHFSVCLTMSVKWFLFCDMYPRVLNILLQQESKIKLLVSGLPQEAVGI